MRIWDLPLKCLCRQHLLAEHRELHAIWSILTGNKKGYAHHPETLRWKGKLKALYKRHESEVAEFKRRNYQHRTSLNKKMAKGRGKQTVFLASKKEQTIILKNKNCPCLNK
ncbi:MAG: pyrimidine dimer DNA glycosylase/endonuclease V [Patescibacteria group bacterium]